MTGSAPLTLVRVCEQVHGPLGVLDVHTEPVHAGPRQRQEDGRNLVGGWDNQSTVPEAGREAERAEMGGVPGEQATYLRVGP